MPCATPSGYLVSLVPLLSLATDLCHDTDTNTNPNTMLVRFIHSIYLFHLDINNTIHFLARTTLG